MRRLKRNEDSLDGPRLLSLAGWRFPPRLGEAAMSPFRGIPQYLAGLKKRKEIYERLCAAARDFLCLELEEQIERAEHPPSFPGQQIAFTPEMLIDANERREEIHGQLEALDAFLEELPEKQADYIKRLQRPMIIEQLKQAEQWISTVQSNLESAASKEPPSPSAAPSTAEKGEAI
jgi:hypothetical protein